MSFRYLPTALAMLLAGCLSWPSLPVPDVSIEPATPGPDDDLVLVLEEIPTGDDRPSLAWEITWTVDGNEATDLAGGEMVPASRTTVGETWEVSVRVRLGDEVGEARTASVLIGSSGDDDDVGPDDDDSGGDDDDSGPVDDDDVGPDDDDVVESGPGSRLCASAGTASGSTYSATTCTGPLTPAQGVSTSDNYTLKVTSFRAIGAGSVR